ncbi:MAG: hypothetical protein ACRCY3_03075 [Sphingorhabdus sp.]
MFKLNKIALAGAVSGSAITIAALALVLPTPANAETIAVCKYNTVTKSFICSPSTTDVDVVNNVTIIGAGASGSGTAVGADTEANTNGLAVGFSAYAAENAVALGSNATAQSETIAIGRAALASGGGTAIGVNSEASSTGISIGRNALTGKQVFNEGLQQFLPAGFNSVALGDDTVATGERSIALGFGSKATGDNSIAIGQGTIASAANHIVLGTNQRLTVAGIANGTAAQTGALKMVTTDANGNFGVADIPAGGGAPVDLTGINTAIAGLQTGQTDLAVKVGVLEQFAENVALTLPPFINAVSVMEPIVGGLMVSDAAQNTRLDALEMLGGGGGGAVDLAPLIGRVDGHDALLASIQTGQAAQDAAIAALQAGGGGGGGGGAPVDLAPVNARVDAVEAVNVVQDGQIAALQTQQAETATTVAEHTTQIASVQQAQMMTASQVAQQGVSIANMQTGMQAMQGQMGAMQGQISSLQQGQDLLFDLVNKGRRDAQRGTAVAVAMADAPLPSAPGKTSYVFNLATFRGEPAMGLSLSHRLNIDAPMAVTFGVSHAGGKNTAVRVGLAGEF